jgi:predicted ATPase
MGLEIRNGSYSALLKVLVSVAQRKDLLLLLDNCEHLLDGVVTFVGDLLRECPQLAFLATSREPLAITGEITYSVPAMYFPSAQAKVDQVIASDAVRLFVERASAVMPGYKIKRDNAQAIGQICRRLDGIPLAIELAAARVRSLSSNEIADRLEDRFRLLTGGSRIELPRLKTLFGSIEWSYELLTEEEQKIFNRSSVFRGGFMLSEAEKVCEGGGIHAADVLHLLTDLVDKSLVVAKRTRDGFARYQLLESLRQFGKDRLSNLGEYDQYSHKHALTYMDLAEEAEPFLEGPEEISWLKRLEPELDNVMAAVRWSLENGFEEIVIRLLAALHVYFMERKQHVPRAADFMSEALTKVGVLESEIQMKGLWTKAVWALYLWDLDEAERLINDTIELAHLHENELMLAKSLNSQASLNMKRGNYEGARDCFEKSFKMFEDLGNKIYLAETNRFLALCVTSNTERVRLLETALGLAREEGIPFMIGVIQSDLGRFHTENTGDLDKANQYFLGALSSSKEREAKYSQSVNNWHLGYIALLRGDYPLATSYFDESREASRRSGIVDMDAWSSLGLAELHRVQREYSLADQLLRDSLEIWDRFPSPGGHVETLITSALVARDKGDYSRAEAISKVALQMAVEHNLEEVHGWVLSILADIKHHSGDLEESIELYRQSLEIRRNAYFYRVLEILEGLAILAVNRKLFELATKLFAAVDQARIVSGIVIPPPRQENYDRAFDTLQRTYDEIKFQEAWSEGILLTLEQAREYALDVLHELN